MSCLLRGDPHQTPFIMVRSKFTLSPANAVFDISLMDIEVASRLFLKTCTFMISLATDVAELQRKLTHQACRALYIND